VKGLVHIYSTAPPEEDHKSVGAYTKMLSQQRKTITRRRCRGYFKALSQHRKTTKEWNNWGLFESIIPHRKTSVERIVAYS
jgi:hypothetical protein